MDGCWDTTGTDGQTDGMTDGRGWIIRSQSDFVGGPIRDINNLNKEVLSEMDIRIICDVIAILKHRDMVIGAQSSLQ